MSIATAITNAQTKVSDAYTACNNKGATMPQTQDLSNLATCISSIQTGGGGSANLTTLNVTPSTSSQQITPTSPIDGYDEVNVAAVTSSIDANIVAGNIKNGISILGVTGTYGGGGGSDEPHTLPSTYTKLSYIENPLGNTAYINTGVSGTLRPLFTIDFMSYDDLASTNYGCILGSRQASNNNDWQLTTYCTSGAGTLRLGGSSYNYNAHLPAKNTRFTASLTSSDYIVDSTTYTVNRQGSIGGGYNLYLFALNQANSVTQNGHGRLYSLKMYYGSHLLRDFIPCKNPSNVVGMYDLINETFYGSANSSVFSAGPAV